MTIEGSFVDLFEEIKGYGWFYVICNKLEKDDIDIKISLRP